MPVQLDAIGTVQPIASVAVKSRIDGLDRRGQHPRRPVCEGRRRAAPARQPRRRRRKCARSRRSSPATARSSTNAKRDVDRFAAAGRQGFRLAPAIRHRRDQRPRRSRRSARPTRRRSRTSRCCSPTTRSRRRSMGGSARSALKAGNNVKANDVPHSHDQPDEADLGRLLAAAERVSRRCARPWKRAPSRSMSPPPATAKPPEQGTRRILRQRDRPDDRHDRPQGGVRQRPGAAVARRSSSTYRSRR